MNNLLNEEQLKAINTISGNLLILASAGTGKTTTIVERYVNLVENHDVKPEEVMMTTFTNKAAKDMIRKIEARTEKVPKYIGTMHSLFLRFLRINVEKINFNPNFTLLTEDNDKKKIIKEILMREEIEPDNSNFLYLLSRIEKFKNRGVIANELDEFPEMDEEGNIIEEEIDGGEFIFVKPEIKRISNFVYKEYQRILKETNTMDFDDILLYTFILFRDDEKLRDVFRRKFKAIMVDEAQDLNVVQINILGLLENNNLCLIGDDCQNIYSWRGSSNELIFSFDTNCKKIVLKDNYRSCKKIIDNVNKIIDSITFKIDKKLSHTKDEGVDIKIKEFYSFKEEMYFLANEIKTLLEKGENPDEVAILFRTNLIGKQIERELRKNKIPCHLSRATGFFEREEIKDILSFVKLKINPHSVLEFERVLKMIEGVGKAKIDKLKEITRRNRMNIVDSLEFAGEIGISSIGKGKLLELQRALGEYEKNPIRQFLDFFDYERKIEEKYSSDPEKLNDKKENIQVLLKLYEFEFDKDSIREYLDSLIDMERKEADSGKVTLSTIHSAKGLEWKHVYLVACNEKILPYYRGSLEKIKRDDELRLFYVAVSRAKDFLTLTHSSSQGWKTMEPSQFLDIIDGDFSGGLENGDDWDEVQMIELD